LVQFEPHALASRAKKAAKNHDPLALIAHSNASSSHSHTNSSYSPQPYYVTHPPSFVDYDDEYQGELQGDSQEDKLTTAMITESKLKLLHMDLCGQMRVASINGKKYILVIVDDYSRFTWVYFLRTKDEAPDMIIDFVNQVQRNLKASILTIRTDNGTEFKNEKLRRNRTLVEAARTMLIISKAPEFMWAEAIATACFTQNCSIVHTRHNKTPYELIRGRKPNVQYFHVFGSFCYPTNDRDDRGKIKPKADIGVFVGYSESSRGFRIYNRRTKKIMEMIHVKFDELTAMASECKNLEPGMNCSDFNNSSEDS
ncbi:retrovirus-related pol polyprotein from transposon TNT 1-94, partial [Tanacetum coccineum]